MTRLKEALKNIQSYSKLPLKAIEQYIRTGDEKFLTQIKPSRRSDREWEGYALAGALSAFADWTEEDRRLLHVLHAAGLLEWMHVWTIETLKQEKPHEDFFAALRVELESRKATAKDIA